MSTDLCVVCDAQSNTYSFGVFCCRACCAFFRRSLNKKYTCRRNNQCKINQDGMRNACRACRLARCRQAGMSADSEKVVQPICLEKPVHHSAKLKFNAGNSSKSLPASDSGYCVIMPPLVSASSSMPDPLPPGQDFYQPTAARYPFISKVLNDFMMLECSQKSLYSIDNPRVIFAEADFQKISHNLFKRMENGTMSLIHNLLYEGLACFGVVQETLKIEVAKQSAYRYVVLFRCYLTAKYFTIPNDKRIATHYGYFIDPEKLDEFFDTTDLEDAKFKQKAELLRPVLNISYKTSNKFRALKVREFEVAALATLLVWNRIEDAAPMTYEMNLKRDSTYREFHDNVLASYGVEEGSVRIVRLLSLLEDILNLNVAYGEMFLMVDIFASDRINQAAGNTSTLSNFLPFH